MFTWKCFRRIEVLIDPQEKEKEKKPTQKKGKKNRKDTDNMKEKKKKRVQRDTPRHFLLCRKR